MEYGDIAQVCGEGIRKAKAQLVLQQQGMWRATQRALVSILATKRQSAGQVLYVAGGLLTKGMEEDEAFNAFFTFYYFVLFCFFIGKIYP